MKQRKNCFMPHCHYRSCLALYLSTLLTLMIHWAFLKFSKKVNTKEVSPKKKFRIPLLAVQNRCRVITRSGCIQSNSRLYLEDAGGR